MKRILTICTIAFLTATTACQKEYEKEYNSAYPLCGEWTVNLLDDNGDLVFGPSVIKTYNSSLSTDSMWIDDYADSQDAPIWVFKAKVAANFKGKTFQTGSSKNIWEDLWGIGTSATTITVTNGAVVGVDSIFLNIEFSDDAGSVYTISGHRRTSYEEYMNKDGAFVHL